MKNPVCGGRNHKGISKFFALVCGGLVAVGVVGCASLTGKAAAPPMADHQQRLYRVSAWKLEGRIAAKFGQEGWNANLLWEHDGAQERLRLFGPFGQGAVSIVLQGDLVYVNEGGGGTSTRSRNPDEFLKQRLGVAVPLHSLRYWVLGLPAPDADYTPTADASGGLAGFEQQGWSLAFEGFDAVGGFTVPKKMTIRGDKATLKLIADEWVFNKN